MRYPSIVCLFALALVAPAGASNRRESYFNRDDARMCVQSPDQVRRVFDNHLLLLNNCDLDGLKRERTPSTAFFVGPKVIKGEEQVDQLMRSFCQPRSSGGFRGIKFFDQYSFIVGNAITVQWIARAPFFDKPVRGSDTYVTCGSKMLSITSTWSPSI